MGILRSRRQQCVSIAIVTVLCTLYLLGLWTGPGRPLDMRVPLTTHKSPSAPAAASVSLLPQPSTTKPVPDEDLTAPTKKHAPKPAPPGQHPVSHLIRTAEAEMESTLARQSKTLGDAVAEYRRRHGGMSPPPNFDKWWDFARARDVQLVDEFDGVAHLLTPFWGLRPTTIRGRAAEALGFAGNLLLGVQIRGGRVAHISGGNDWHRKALSGMMASFVEHLPDMDLAFNVHDEPRVVVPHDDMDRLVGRATHERTASAAVKKPRNSFSSSSPSGGDFRPVGLAPNGGFDAVGTTRFNTYAHQPTWLHSRASCAPGSAARILDDSERVDDVSQSLMGELGFVYNVTALSDVCSSPSLATSFGLFERPNAYSVIQELFPIFSASKVSSYADILYPAPWYWYEKVAYDEAQDPSWESKKAKLYWRGSTTGGYSRNGGWRRHHRQRMVEKLSHDASEPAKILEPVAAQQLQMWRAKPASRSRLASLFDVFFSHVGQCDPADCDEQERHFTVKGRTRPESAWHYRHLLDVDGNAFSGRFYAFLRSRSLVYKLSIFREWHADWLMPWVHYVPMSLRGDDWAELVRYFSQDGPDGGDEMAERMALRGREWAAKVLRNEDLEVWFFRMLLEYGRVVDDERQNIGYST